MAKRKYYRKCGECGSKHDQSEMIRTNLSDNGWLCRDCYNQTQDYYDGYAELEDTDFDYDW